MRTFFRRAAKGEFQIEHSGALWRLLQKITRRKILKHVEYQGALKQTPDVEAYGADDQLGERDPTAAEARLLGDVLESVLDDLKPVDSGIFRLQLHGMSISEIVDIVCTGLVCRQIKAHFHEPDASSPQRPAHTAEKGLIRCWTFDELSEAP